MPGSSRDESGAYRPPDDVPYERLLDELRDTRAVTVQLARRVVAEGRAEAVVEHNSLGALTAGGWLRYLRCTRTSRPGGSGRGRPRVSGPG
jgi:hypothetical protein